ncbi:hypothetical protein Gotri_002124 [Gossypium trilobum]|uniref:Uncharacterized protein n=1 Tax=Gossypium trilobum TaxID=34281 RepID=A0A7J9F795_9ROSI|nr:hypothetical protein [Gossypium trilobum]
MLQTWKLRNGQCKALSFVQALALPGMKLSTYNAYSVGLGPWVSLLTGGYGENSQVSGKVTFISILEEPSICHKLTGLCSLMFHDALVVNCEALLHGVIFDKYDNNLFHYMCIVNFSFCCELYVKMSIYGFLQEDIWCFGWQNSGVQSKDGKDMILLGGISLNSLF